MSDPNDYPSVQPDSSPSLSGVALSSLVFGVLGFFTAGFTGVIAVLLGHIALSQIRRSGGLRTGRWVAIGGLVTGYLGFLLILGFFFAIHTLLEDAFRVGHVRADFKSFESELELYRINAGVYPSTGQGLGALVEKPELAPEPKRWIQILRKVPVDSWNRAYDYQFPGRTDPEKPEVISRGPDGITGTADDMSSQDPSSQDP